MSYFWYGLGFFVFTFLLQGVLHKCRKNKNMQYPIWAGSNIVIIVAMSGIIAKNPAYLGAVIGYILADNIGKELGWH